MRPLTHSVICEDVAHYNFITLYLFKFFQENKITFLFDNDFFLRFKASNSKEVLRKCKEAAIIGFRDYDLDFLIVGIDYDDRNRKQFDREINDLYGNINLSDENIIIIMFPIGLLVGLKVLKDFIRI